MCYRLLHQKTICKLTGSLREHEGNIKHYVRKEGFTKSRLAAFDLKYPKKQMFTKVELAKYINAWQEVYNGKSLVIGPHIVVRGNEKNYARFMNYNLPEIKHIDVAYLKML